MPRSVSAHSELRRRESQLRAARDGALRAEARLAQEEEALARQLRFAGDIEPTEAQLEAARAALRGRLAEGRGEGEQGGEQQAAQQPQQPQQAQQQQQQQLLRQDSTPGGER